MCVCVFFLWGAVGGEGGDLTLVKGMGRRIPPPPFVKCRADGRERERGRKVFQHQKGGQRMLTWMSVLPSSKLGVGGEMFLCGIANGIPVCMCEREQEGAFVSALPYVSERLMIF